MVRLRSPSLEEFKLLKDLFLRILKNQTILSISKDSRSIFSYDLGQSSLFRPRFHPRQETAILSRRDKSHLDNSRYQKSVFKVYIKRDVLSTKTSLDKLI
ncbi:MAG: hypothetical protein ABH858_00985 [Candidatus Omnitrophota bacterium]